MARAEASAATSAYAGARGMTALRAPIAGSVLRVLRESAGPVAAGTALLEIGDTNSLEVVGDFLTTDAMAVRAGAAARIVDWGGDRPLAARVRRVDPGAYTKVSALGLEEQRVPIVLDLVADRPPAFGHGFHVNVVIDVWEGHSVVTVPSTALFRDGQNWAVFVVRGGRAEIRQVDAGRSDNTRTVIERGLQAGEEIVLQPSDTLTDGARVRPLTTSQR